MVISSVLLSSFSGGVALSIATRAHVPRHNENRTFNRGRESILNLFYAAMPASIFFDRGSRIMRRARPRLAEAIDKSCTAIIVLRHHVRRGKNDEEAMHHRCFAYDGKCDMSTSHLFTRRRVGVKSACRQRVIIY